MIWMNLRFANTQFFILTVISSSSLLCSYFCEDMMYHLYEHNRLCWLFIAEWFESPIYISKLNDCFKSYNLRWFCWVPSSQTWWIYQGDPPQIILINCTPHLSLTLKFTFEFANRYIFRIHSVHGLVCLTTPSSKGKSHPWVLKLLLWRMQS